MKKIVVLILCSVAFLSSSNAYYSSITTYMGYESKYSNTKLVKVIYYELRASGNPTYGLWAFGKITAYNSNNSKILGKTLKVKTNTTKSIKKYFKYSKGIKIVRIEAAGEHIWYEGNKYTAPGSAFVKW